MSERKIINDLKREVEYRFAKNISKPPRYSKLKNRESNPFDSGEQYLELKIERGTGIEVRFKNKIQVRSVTADPGRKGGDVYIYHIVVPRFDDSVNGSDDDIELVEPDIGKDNDH